MVLATDLRTRKLIHIAVLDPRQRSAYIRRSKAQGAKTANTSFGEVRGGGGRGSLGLSASLERLDQNGWALPSSVLTSIRLPIDWGGLGFSPPMRIDGVGLFEGTPAWSWDGPLPDLAVPEAAPGPASESEGWGMDHVVLLVPELDVAIAALDHVGHEPRLKVVVKDRPTAFFRVGTVLEIIETGVAFATLYGVALVSEAPLDEVAARWRRAGFDVGEPHDAVQPGRSIFSVEGLDAGLAVMTPDQ